MLTETNSDFIPDEVDTFNTNTTVKNEFRFFYYSKRSDFIKNEIEINFEKNSKTNCVLKIRKIANPSENEKFNFEKLFRNAFLLTIFQKN